MAVITANTGANDWNTNGAWVGSVQPSAGDDVVIPATASVNIPAATTVLGRSLTVAASGTLIFAATTSICTLGDGTAGLGNVALSVSATATITLTGVGTINFISTSATQQTIATGGKTLPTYTINGTGSSYLLSDANTSSGTVNLSKGTLDTNGQTCVWGSFVSNSGVTRTLTMGASSITVSAVGNGWTLTTTAMTLTPGTSTITCAGNTTFAGGGATYNNLVFNNPNGANPGITGANTFANITVTATAVKTGTFFIAANQTVTTALTLSGNSTINRLLVYSQTVGTKFTFTAAAVTISNVDFSDIGGAGVAAPFTGTSLGDALGNTGITFDAPTTQSWLSAVTGSWSDATKWTSRVPLPQDTVTFTNTFSSQTVTCDMPRMGKDITWIGSGSLTWTFSVSTTIYGNLTIRSGVTPNGTITIALSGRSSQTLTSGGQNFVNQNLTFGGFNGTYTLQDSLTTAGIITTTPFSGVTLNANNFNVTASTFTGNNGTTLTMGSGTWSITSTAALNAWNMGLIVTINANTSTIAYTTASTNTRGFNGKTGQTYNNLVYTVAGSTGGLDFVTGGHTFNSFSFSDASNARTLRFLAGATNTFTTFNVNGTAGKLMTISSITAATHTLSKASGIVSDDYLSITNSIATGGASWYAGANSTDGGGNTGWIFTAPRGGSGNLMLMGIG